MVKIRGKGIARHRVRAERPGPSFETWRATDADGSRNTFSCRPRYRSDGYWLPAYEMSDLIKVDEVAPPEDASKTLEYWDAHDRTWVRVPD